ncbi:coiled-coil domain-containing protein 74B [Aulostomus maculatus]
MSSNNLPPVRHLPQWSRVGRLGKPCSQRRLLLNQLQPQPPPLLPPVLPVAAQEPRHNYTDPRVASLQRSIQFLQEQHQQTLEKLHEEVEYLRRANKELQYKLIMEPLKSSRKGMLNSRLGLRPLTQGSETSTRLHLEEPPQETQASRDQTLSVEGCREILRSSGSNQGTELKGGLITSLQPLRIHSNPSHPPRAPTLQECEVIIRQLYNANSLQSQEIVCVKALLRDIALSKKITTENYILTKAYLADGTRKSVEDKKSPKLGLQTLPARTTGAISGVILPALKQSLSSTVADRQRRTRAVQRDRFKTTVR